jgi:translation elongation factor EF-1alpha
MPIGELCTVKSIQAHEESVKWAQAGDNVEVHTTHDTRAPLSLALGVALTKFLSFHWGTQLTVQGLDVVSFKVGSVLCDPEHPVRVATAFKAQIYVFPTQIPIIKGTGSTARHTHDAHDTRIHDTHNSLQIVAVVAHKDSKR